MEHNLEPVAHDDPHQSFLQGCEDAGRRCRAAIRKLCPELESLCMKCPDKALLYAKDVINGRWPEAESIILTHPRRIAEYAESVIRGRWPEAEAALLAGAEGDEANDYGILRYVDFVVKGRWTEAEPRIIRMVGGPAVWYARYILNRRWTEAEPFIQTEAMPACNYAIDVIRGRWPEAEDSIAADDEAAEEYLVKILRHNWNEDAAGVCPLWAYAYAKFVVRGKLPGKLHQKMVLWSWQDEFRENRFVKRYVNGKEYQ